MKKKKKKHFIHVKLRTVIHPTSTTVLHIPALALALSVATLHTRHPVLPHLYVRRRALRGASASECFTDNAKIVNHTVQSMQRGNNTGGGGIARSSRPGIR